MTAVADAAETPTLLLPHWRLVLASALVAAVVVAREPKPLPGEAMDEDEAIGG